MIARVLRWDCRCADCRMLLTTQSTAYRINDRLLCPECAAELEWMEAAL